jgi:outer membrane lipopolysaccharide assembly protein LptE/RlpB
MISYHLPVIVLVALFTILTGCFNREKNVRITPFSRSTIDSVTIRKFQPKSDSVVYLTRRLDDRQVNDLVYQINNATSERMTKSGVDLVIAVYTNDNKMREIYTFSNNFKLKKEHGDWAFSIKELNFFEELVKNQ